MKLIRFTIDNSRLPSFGVVIQDQAVPFAVLQSKAGKSSPHLADSRSYLANLPDSEWAAKELLGDFQKIIYPSSGPNQDVPFWQDWVTL